MRSSDGGPGSKPLEFGPRRHVRHALIGRSDELGLLRASADDALASRGRVALISGEPGIGKTRLAEETADYVAARGFRVIWGRCWDSGGEPPFWPWIQLVREGLRISSVAIPERLRRLAFMAPEPGSALETASRKDALPVPEAASEPTQRFLLFDAASNFFKQIAAAAPLLIVMDDLHAADEDSLSLLHFLARDLKQLPILIVATYRATDLRRSSSHVSLLADITREGLTIPLRGLDEAEISQLVEHHPLLRARNSITPWLHRVSGGNPFFLLEIASSLAAQPVIVQRSFDTAAVPDSIRAAVQRRTSAFREQTREILDVCALLGQEFDLPLLSEVCGLPSEEIVNALDEAVNNLFIAEVGNGAGRYSFVHAITAEALRSELDTNTRLRIHQRIGAAIEAVYCEDIDNHLAELAHHHISSLPLGSIDKAVEFSTRAARQAHNRLAFAEASRLAAMALLALSRKPRNEIERYDLLLLLGEAQAQGRSLREARQSFEKAIAVARSLRRSDLLAQAVLAASVWSDSYFKSDSRLITLLTEALDALSKEEGVVRIALMAKLAVERYWSGDRENGHNVCHDAVAAARRLGNPRALVSALWAENQITWGPDNLEQRIARTTEIAFLAESVGEFQHALRAHEMRFAALFEKGDIDAVEAEVRSYGILAERSGEQFGIIERFQAALALFRGDFSQADLKTAELMRHAERRQDLALIACSRMLKEAISIERAEIDPVEMETFCKDRIAQQSAVSIGSRASLALFYIVMGRRAEARAELEFLATDDFSLIPRDWNWLAAVCAVAVVCVALRDLPRTNKVYDLLSPYGMRNITVGWGDLSYGCSSRLLGVLATALGKFEEAEAHFDRAIQFDQLAGATPWVAYAKLELARMLFKRGERSDLDRAFEMADQACDTAKNLHMKLLEMRATALVAKIAIPATTRSASSAASGTPQLQRQRVIASVMFVDIVGSTEHVAALSDSRWVEVRTRFFELTRVQVGKFLGREIDTAGDSMLALFDQPIAAIRAAFAIAVGARTLALQVRAGIHFGEIELVDRDAAGIAVHIGARVASFAGANEVVVSSTVRDMMAGGDIKFADRGTHILKGVPGEWRLYAVESYPESEI